MFQNYDVRSISVCVTDLTALRSHCLVHLQVGLINLGPNKSRDGVFTKLKYCPDPEGEERPHV